MNELFPLAGDQIRSAIVSLRGQHVLLDADLAALYGVPTKVLNQGVVRNKERFPVDFMFQLTAVEWENLKSQIVTSSGWGGRRNLPYAFTEQGVAMLSCVLRSPRAVVVSIEIMRAFVQLRQLVGSHAELAKKLQALEAKYDIQFRSIFQAIRDVMASPVITKRRIGFYVSKE